MDKKSIVAWLLSLGQEELCNVLTDYNKDECDKLRAMYNQCKHNGQGIFLQMGDHFEPNIPTLSYIDRELSKHITKSSSSSSTNDTNNPLKNIHFQTKSSLDPAIAHYLPSIPEEQEEKLLDIVRLCDTAGKMDTFTIETNSISNRELIDLLNTVTQHQFLSTCHWEPSTSSNKSKTPNWLYSKAFFTLGEYIASLFEKLIYTRYCKDHNIDNQGSLVSSNNSGSGGSGINLNSSIGSLTSNSSSNNSNNNNLSNSISGGGGGSGSSGSRSRSSSLSQAKKDRTPLSVAMDSRKKRLKDFWVNLSMVEREKYATVKLGNMINLALQTLNEDIHIEQLELLLKNLKLKFPFNEQHQQKQQQQQQSKQKPSTTTTNNNNQNNNNNLISKSPSSTSKNSKKENNKLAMLLNPSTSTSSSSLSLSMLSMSHTQDIATIKSIMEYALIHNPAQFVEFLCFSPIDRVDTPIDRMLNLIFKQLQNYCIEQVAMDLISSEERSIKKISRGQSSLSSSGGGSSGGSVSFGGSGSTSSSSKNRSKKKKNNSSLSSSKDSIGSSLSTQSDHQSSTPSKRKKKKKKVVKSQSVKNLGNHPTHDEKPSSDTEDNQVIQTRPRRHSLPMEVETGIKGILAGDGSLLSTTEDEDYLASEGDYPYRLITNNNNNNNNNNNTKLLNNNNVQQPKQPQSPQRQNSINTRQLPQQSKKSNLQQHQQQRQNQQLIKQKQLQQQNHQTKKLNPTTKSENPEEEDEEEELEEDYDIDEENLDWYEEDFIPDDSYFDTTHDSTFEMDEEEEDYDEEDDYDDDLSFNLKDLSLLPSSTITSSSSPQSDSKTHITNLSRSFEGINTSSQNNVNNNNNQTNSNSNNNQNNNITTNKSYNLLKSSSTSDVKPQPQQPQPQSQQQQQQSQSSPKKSTIYTPPTQTTFPNNTFFPGSSNSKSKYHPPSSSNYNKPNNTYNKPSHSFINGQSFSQIVIGSLNQNNNQPKLNVKSGYDFPPINQSNQQQAITTTPPSTTSSTASPSSSTSSSSNTTITSIHPPPPLSSSSSSSSSSSTTSNQQQIESSEKKYKNQNESKHDEKSEQETSQKSNELNQLVEKDKYSDWVHNKLFNQIRSYKQSSNFQPPLPAYLQPWDEPPIPYPHPNFSIKLHQEILDFVSDVGDRTYPHIQSCHLVIGMIENVVKKLWPNAELEIYGSFMTGLWLPSSDIDTVVNYGKNMSIGPRNAQFLLEVLEKQIRHDLNNYILTMLCIPSAKIPVIKLVTKENIAVDISFRESPTSPHTGIAARDLVGENVKKVIGLYPLAIVLKWFLRERGLNNTYSGGLSSYCLVLMLISFLKNNEHCPKKLNGQQQQQDNTNNNNNNNSQQLDQPTLYAKPCKCDYNEQELSGLNIGCALMRFLEYYGVNFNYQKTGISIEEGKYTFPLMDNQNTGNQNYNTPPQPPSTPTTTSSSTTITTTTNGIINRDYTTYLYVLDPFVPGKNVAAGSFNFGRVKAAFQYAFVTLSNASMRESFENESILSKILMPDKKLI